MFLEFFKITLKICYNRPNFLTALKDILGLFPVTNKGPKGCLKRAKPFQIIHSSLSLDLLPEILVCSLQHCGKTHIRAAKWFGQLLSVNSLLDGMVTMWIKFHTGGLCSIRFYSVGGGGCVLFSTTHPFIYNK